MDISSFPAFDLEPAGTAATRWTTWLARLENFLVAYNISNDGRMKAILLHCAGEAVFERFEALGRLAGFCSNQGMHSELFQRDGCGVST